MNIEDSIVAFNVSSVCVLFLSGIVLVDGRRLYLLLFVLRRSFIHFWQYPSIATNKEWSTCSTNSFEDSIYLLLEKMISEHIVNVS